MEKMMQNKLAVKIICTAMAIILWLYVSYQENPSMTETVRNVPLALVGEQALKESGFSVYSTSRTSVDVKVTAKRMTLARISNKTISAVINVSSIKESGTYTMPAAISSPITSGATYLVKGKDIKIIVEPIEKKTYNVEADIAQSQNASIILRSCELSQNKVSVSAPQSILNAIETVKTQQIVPEKGAKEQTLKLVAFGKDGKALEGVEFSPSEVKATYSLYDIKKVPVVLKTTGDKTYSLPSEYTLKIYGSGENFDMVTQIETEELNMALFEPQSRVRIKLNLPVGVTLLDNSNEIEVVLDKSYYN